MFTADGQVQDLWLADDAQGESIVSSVSGPSRSDLDNFTAGLVKDLVKGKQRSEPPSIANGSGHTKIPGVVRTGDANLLRNGQPTLPAEKAFAIQIGSRQFRLSGASIMSDGEPADAIYRFEGMLKSLERLPTSLPTSKNSCD